MNEMRLRLQTRFLKLKFHMQAGNPLPPPHLIPGTNIRALSPRPATQSPSGKAGLLATDLPAGETEPREDDIIRRLNPQGQDQDPSAGSPRASVLFSHSLLQGISQLHEETGGGE